MSNRLIYNVFSGLIFEIPEKDIKILDVSQVPLKKMPKSNCNKCYGRHYVGRDSENFVYYVCGCLRKVVDFDSVKNVDIQ